MNFAMEWMASLFLLVILTAKTDRPAAVNKKLFEYRIFSEGLQEIYKHLTFGPCAPNKNLLIIQCT